MNEIPGQGDLFEPEQGKIERLQPQIELAAKLKRIADRAKSEAKPAIKGHSEARQEETSYEGRRTQADINRDGLTLAREALKKNRKKPEDTDRPS